MCIYLDQVGWAQRAERVKLDVTSALDAAWRLPDADRRRVVRRLLLRWHPDKNVDADVDLATAVTQHIRAELDRLDGEEALERAGYAPDARNPFAGSDSFRRRFAAAFRFYADQMDCRAREHRAQRDRYRENLAREYSAAYQPPPAAAGSAAPPPSFASSNPQPAQARRFLRQAREDYRSAGHDFDADEPSYEWVAFKVYQVRRLLDSSFAGMCTRPFRPRPRRD